MHRYLSCIIVLCNVMIILLSGCAIHSQEMLYILDSSSIDIDEVDVRVSSDSRRIHIPLVFMYYRNTGPYKINISIANKDILDSLSSLNIWIESQAGRKEILCESSIDNLSWHRTKRRLWRGHYETIYSYDWQTKGFEIDLSNDEYMTVYVKCKINETPCTIVRKYRYGESKGTQFIWNAYANI